MSILNMTIKEISELLKNRKIGTVELVRHYLDSIRRQNPSLNSFVTTCEEDALEASEKAQKLIDSNDNTSLLCGIPFGIKDNICVRGIRTTAGSKMLSDFVPAYSSTVVKRLVEANAVILGKLNMNEFSMKESKEGNIFGFVRNPWNKEYAEGGLSEGTAAAVSGDMACFALGSDSGGELRQAASFCGVVGLKPTYGLVSRYGLISSASSMDQIGPVTRSVEDCAAVMSVIAGQDPLDSTSVGRSENYLKDIDKGIKGLRVGVPKEFFGSEVNTEIKESISRALENLGQEGAIYKEISIPSIKYILPAHYIISSAEASSNLARYDGIRFGHRSPDARNISEVYRFSRKEGFGREVKQRILTGTYFLSSENRERLYYKALKIRRMIFNDFRKAFENLDVLVAPVCPEVACKLTDVSGDKDHLLKMHISDVYTAGLNLTGLPGLTVPCGLDKNKLPIGIQIVGREFSEKLLLQVGYAIEKTVGKLSPGEGDKYGI